MARTKYKTSLTILPTKPRANKKVPKPKMALPPGDPLSKGGARSRVGQAARMPKGL